VLCSQGLLSYSAFKYFSIERQMKVIPETHYFFYNEKEKQYHVAVTVPKFIRKIIERVKIDTLNNLQSNT
jgi:hypothetical protein